MEVRFHRNFKKRFRKISVKIQEQFNERLELFMRDKFSGMLNNHSVEGYYPNCRSINVSGDYRAIFKDKGDTVIFITIGNHSDLY